MDGLEITKKALNIASAKLPYLGNSFRKSSAIDTIRRQPFFGNYWQGRNLGNTLRIRIPTNYKDKS